MPFLRAYTTAMSLCLHRLYAYRRKCSLLDGECFSVQVVNGHVDNMATFSEPGTILLSWSDDPNDPQHEISKRNLEILEQETDAMGRRLKVILLPCPGPGMFRSIKEADTMDPGEWAGLCCGCLRKIGANAHVLTMCSLRFNGHHIALHSA